MKTELFLKFEFEASHSLQAYEVPHPHLWRLKVGVSGEPVQGWIVDLVVLRERVQRLIDAVSLTYLNENQKVSSEVRQYPTCETLSLFYYHQIEGVLNSEFIVINPSVKLNSVEVSISDLNRVELGAVRLS